MSELALIEFMSKFPEMILISGLPIFRKQIKLDGVKKIKQNTKLIFFSIVS